MLNSRKNGSVGLEEYGELDYDEGIRLGKLIQKKFPNLLVEIETVDEWVQLNIQDKPIPKFRYSFIKRDETNCGFTQTFNDLDELIKRYNDWIKVDWASIKIALNKSNGEDKNHELLLSAARTEGNDWGYSFYITKRRYY